MVTIERKKLEQVLAALEYASTGNRRPEIIVPAITAIKEALAQPAQEPVGCMRCATPKKCATLGCSPNTWPPENITPQQRQWVGLTDDERIEALCAADGCERLESYYFAGPVQKAAVLSFADAIEAKLKEKNT